MMSQQELSSQARPEYHNPRRTNNIHLPFENEEASILVSLHMNMLGLGLTSKSPEINVTQLLV